MSKLTATEVRGMMEAYSQVYAPLQEELDIEDLGIQMIENAAYILFSQGYNVNDVISYFSEASEDTIVEDFVNFAEENLIIENVVVSDEYIEEQFEQLDEVAGLLARGAGLVAKGLGAVARTAGAGQKAAKATQVASRARNIQNIRSAKNLVPAGRARVTTSGAKPGFKLPGSGPKITTSGGKAAGPNMLQKAAGWAKTSLGKLPGAKAAANVLKSPAGKLASKVGGKVIPGVGAALYGADAADRLKKGDWGGAALSGLGAATSFAGPVAALAPLAVQTATDAMGLTGDKSKKGPSAKTAPAGAPKPKGGAGMVNVQGKGQRYYASSDKKYYKNYNDALAARNSRRGVTAPTAKAAPAPAAPSTPAASSAAPEVKATNAIAAKPSQPAVKPSATPQLSPGGRRSNADLEDKTFATGKTAGGTTFERRTPTSAEMKAAKAAGGGEAGVKAAVERSSKLMGGPEGPGKVDTANVQASLKDTQEREKKKAQVATTTAKPVGESYDAFDIVLEYLINNGHAETVTEAAYIMTEMDAETISDIVEAKYVTKK